MSRVAHLFGGNPSRNALLALLIVSLCLRIIHWSIARPKVYPDSSEYALVAASLRSGDFREYTGERTAVYPLLLLACGMDYTVVWFVQSCLGIATSLLLFSIVKGHTRDPVVGFLAGLFHSISINVLFFESAVLAETLSTFLLTLSLFLVITMLTAPEDSTRRAVACGFVVALAALARPLLLYLPFLCVFFLVVRSYSRDTPLGAGIRVIAAFLLPALLIICGWSAFNKATVNYFGPTTLLGYNLTQHSGQMMQDAPEEFATIREVFLRHRQAQQEQNGTMMFTVFMARPDLMQATGLSVAELSKVLTNIALRLFIDHPVAYLSSVFESWKLFWTVPIYWDRYAISPQKMGRLMETLWKGEKEILFVLRLAFVVISFSRILSGVIRRNFTWNEVFSTPWVLGAAVLVASVVQAFLEAGENARYSIPFQSLMIVVVLFAIVRPAVPPDDQTGTPRLRTAPPPLFIDGSTL